MNLFLFLLLGQSIYFSINSKFVSKSILDSLTREISLEGSDSAIAEAVSERLISFLEGKGVINPQIRAEIRVDSEFRYFDFLVENEQIIVFKKAIMEVEGKTKEVKWAYSSFLKNGIFLRDNFLRTSLLLRKFEILEPVDYAFLRDVNEWSLNIKGKQIRTPPIFLLTFDQKDFVIFSRISISTTDVYPMRFGLNLDLRNRTVLNLQGVLVIPFSIQNGLYMEIKGGYSSSQSAVLLKGGKLWGEFDAACFGKLVDGHLNSYGLRGTVEGHLYRTMLELSYHKGFEHILYFEYSSGRLLSPGFLLLKTNRIQDFPHLSGIVSIKQGEPFLECSVKFARIVLSRTFFTSSRTGLGYVLPVRGGNVYLGISLDDGRAFPEEAKINFCLFKKSPLFDYLLEFY